MVCFSTRATNPARDHARFSRWQVSAGSCTLQSRFSVQDVHTSDIERKIGTVVHTRATRPVRVEAIRQIISAQSGPENEQGGLQMQDKDTGRRIVFAVDGTSSCEEGLKWLSRQIARKGEAEL